MSPTNETPKRDQPSPSNPSSGTGRGWRVPVVVVLLVVAAIILIGVAKQAEKRKSNPETVSAVPAEPVSAPVTNVPPAVSTPAEAATNSPPANSAPSLKLQGIVYNATRPWAIVDGKTVYAGSSVGNYRVKEISPNTVTLEDTNGSPRTLFLHK